MQVSKLRSQIALLVLLLAGCAGSKVSEGSKDALPDPFTLELRAYARGQRSVYYVLERDGTLRYGGGRDANNRLAPHTAGVLSQEERLRLWRLIVNHRLLEARGRGLLPHGTTTYEVKLRAASRRNSFHSADQSVPGLDELDRMLFQLQAHKRYRAE